MQSSSSLENISYGNGGSLDTGVNAIDQIMQSKSRILKTKLEVLAGEIRQRLSIREGNLERIGRDKDVLKETIERLDRLANYKLRDHRDKVPLYQRTIELEKEQRAQDVECWRDVVKVMRDFLEIWEAQEQAKSRAIFLNG